MWEDSLWGQQDKRRLEGKLYILPAGLPTVLFNSPILVLSLQPFTDTGFHCELKTSGFLEIPCVFSDRLGLLRHHPAWWTEHHCVLSSPGLKIDISWTTQTVSCELN